MGFSPPTEALVVQLGELTSDRTDSLNSAAAPNPMAVVIASMTSFVPHDELLAKASPTTAYKTTYIASRRGESPEYKESENASDANESPPILAWWLVVIEISSGAGSMSSSDALASSLPGWIGAYCLLWHSSPDRCDDRTDNWKLRY